MLIHVYALLMMFIVLTYATVHVVHVHIYTYLYINQQSNSLWFKLYSHTGINKYVYVLILQIRFFIHGYALVELQTV